MKKVDLEVLERTIEEIFSKEEFLKKLKEKRPLIIKYGVDVTSPFLHIGHAVNLWQMRYLQECGHKIVFLVGDFTTRIGDPTGKSKLRKILSIEEIEKNAKEFIKQVSTILYTDKDLFEVKYNSSWYDKMSLDDFLQLCAMVTHSKLIQRDMFQKRIEKNTEIHIHEMLYPILQGYDSVLLKSDVTIVGSDQLFNELMGRFYQEKFGQSPQIIITTKITPGTDGVEKQSKSLGNYIALEDSAKDKFGKIMSISDALIISYLQVYTTISLKEIERIKDRMEEGENPMIAKKVLAKAIVERYHGPEVAKMEEEAFEQIFSQRKEPKDILQVKVDKKDILSVLKICMPNKSKTFLRNLINGHGVKVNGQKINLETEIKHGDIVSVGRRNWFKVVF